MRFAGKTAVNTGAASGIGKAAVLKLPGEGAHVFAADIDEDAPDEAELITAPVGSVIETIVLLNVDLMWAWPSAMFFFSLRRGLRAEAFGAAISSS